jgi:hypothetical protein
MRTFAWVIVFVAAGASRLHAGAFIGSDSITVDTIMHPKGYTGVGGTLALTVCIDPTSANAAAMEISVQNAVATWNGLVATSGNLVFGASNNVPATDYDFESATLHEMGHCIGLDHPNLSTESGLAEPDRNYTKSTTGPNTTYDLDDGADNIRGSRDDLRGDDVNLHWFRKSNNNPFTIDATVDASTYSRSLADLPAGDSYAANADRDVGAALGFADTEAVMQQGQFNDEAQRTLNHDDVATLRFGMSGLDETAGTSDDYTLTLTYGGIASGCDIMADFDDTQTGFATCAVSATNISGDHWSVTDANMYFNSTVAWFFNDVPNTGTTTTTSSTTTTTTTVTTTTTTTGPATTTTTTTTIPTTTSSTLTTTTTSSTTTTSTLPPFAIDHFMLYRIKTTAGAPKFVAFGAVTLHDQFRTAGYDVLKPKQLGLPADKNAGGRIDPNTHLKEYQLKAHAGVPTFSPVTNVRVTNQCNNLLIEVRNPLTVLVPTNKSTTPPPVPSINDHQLDHYLCYQARAQTKLDSGAPLPKFPKGIQVEVIDQFQSRRYDLKKITKLCTPVDKSGSPVLLGGPNVGAPFPITPAAIRHPSDHLVCYQAKLATKQIAQNGCGPLNPADHGTAIVPPQPKHTRRIGLFTNNQFGPEQIDSVVEGELCIPSVKIPPP